MAVSAAAFVLAFPPYDLGALAWFALVPLITAFWRRPPRDAFWIGYAWGAFAYGGVLWWLTGFGVLVWALAAALLALAPAVALGTAAWAGAGGARRAVLWIPITWTAVEFLRGRGSLGIPWALLGESQHAALAVSQVASLTGVYGLTLLVVLVNAAVTLLLARASGIAPAALTAAAVAAALGYGSAALATPVRADTNVALVQPAYEARMRWDPAQAARDLRTLDAMTHDAARSPDRGRGAVLVLWPETASPVDLTDPSTRALVGGWARRDHTTLIATSLEGGLTNSAFAVAPDGVVVGRYDKHRLVPFAEAGERPGRGPALLPAPAGTLGVAICFESTFPEHARDAVRDGAAMLAVLTNDAWFDGRAAPLQHAAIAPFRAIEEGRFLLRAANAGPSEIIDPYGRVVAALPLGARGVLAGRVAPRSALTLYARYGDVLPWAAVAASAAAVVPKLAPLAIGDGRGRAFVRLAGASALPLAALFAVDAIARSVADGGAAWAPAPGGVPVPLPPLALLVAAALLSIRRPAAEIGFGRGFVPALLVSLAAVAGLAAVALRAFTAHGGAMPVAAPAAGWWSGAVPMLIAGLGFEWWLRGVVFAAATTWRGPAWAVPWGAVLGALAYAPRGAEAMLWGLIAGVVFGLVRRRWAQVPALAIAHGAGAAIFDFLFGPW
ncbi:MAG TPA: apolipoprotein N-acyltransferase [bacterium]|nr:apolipoprotein N-acyltransferase [bacterium]